MPHDHNAPTHPYSVRTRTLERRYRAGHCFGLVAVAVDLTAAQAQLVQADPELVCESVPAPELTLEAGSEAVPASSKVKTKARAST